MVGLDDVKERIREGVSAHSWSAVLWQVYDAITLDWEYASEDGPTEQSERLKSAAACVRGAIQCMVFSHGWKGSLHESLFAGCLALIEVGHADTRGLMTAEDLAERLAAVLGRHLSPGMFPVKGSAL